MAGMTALANKSSYKLGAFWEKASCMENSLKDATEQKALGILPERPSGSTACGTWGTTASSSERWRCKSLGKGRAIHPKSRKPRELEATTLRMVRKSLTRNKYSTFETDMPPTTDIMSQANLCTVQVDGTVALTTLLAQDSPGLRKHASSTRKSEVTLD